MSPTRSAPTQHRVEGAGLLPAPAADLRPTDLVVFVWPHHTSFEFPPRGHDAREDVADATWAMNAAKAERARILVSVYGETIIGAWLVTGCENVLAAPKGKTRLVNRARFGLADDPRLAYLVGQRSQVARRRNPQTTIELYDLDGSDTLLDQPSSGQTGVVRVGPFTLVVREDGTADLTYPAQASLTLHPEG